MNEYIKNIILRKKFNILMICGMENKTVKPCSN